MTTVLLVIRSYFDALHIKSLIDWEKNGYKLILELNAISGLHRLSDLRPDILLIHHDTGWLDADAYLEYIHRMYLPTQLILLLGQRGTQATGKNLFRTSEGIQVVDCKSLSSRTLARALQTAADGVLLTERENSEAQKRSAVQEVLPSKRLHELSALMPEQNICLMRLIISEKAQAFSVCEQMENAFLILLQHPQKGQWFRENTGDYCILIDLADNYSTYSRVEYLNNLAQTLLRSAKEILLGDAYLTISYRVSQDGLTTQYQYLQQIERYHYFCRETELLSISSVTRARQPSSEPSIDVAIWQIYRDLVQENATAVEQGLQELYLKLLKGSMSFDLLERAHSLLREVYQFVCGFGKLPMAETAPPAMPATPFATIEQELDASLSVFQALLLQVTRFNAGLHSVALEALRRLLLSFATPISMNLLADEMGITPSYLSKLYKQQLGIGLAEHLRDIRMAYAKVLMQHGLHDIRSVAEQSGFPDPKYFSRIFRQQFGQTPTEFIQQLQPPQAER